MTGRGRARAADVVPSNAGAGHDVPGVTRFDLACSRGMDDTARELARGWCTARAVPGEAADGIATLLLLALQHGLRFDPRAVAIGLRWLDPDRVAVDVRWRGCGKGARTGDIGTRADVESTAAAFGALAESWGLRAGTPQPVHWFVVDTARRSQVPSIQEVGQPSQRVGPGCSSTSVP